jgi:rRNA-processing protein CGR1
MMKDKPLKTSWEKKVESKNLKKNIKLYEKELKEARAKRLEVRFSNVMNPSFNILCIFQDKRKRSELNAKRREENQRKAEIVQTVCPSASSSTPFFNHFSLFQINNPAKLKRMRKKQLRQIEKR